MRQDSLGLRERWELLAEGATCPICTRGPPLTSKGFTVEGAVPASSPTFFIELTRVRSTRAGKETFSDGQ